MKYVIEITNRSTEQLALAVPHGLDADAMLHAGPVMTRSGARAASGVYCCQPPPSAL
jgi:hypothetical protein